MKLLLYLVRRTFLVLGRRPPGPEGSAPFLKGRAKDIVEDAIDEYSEVFLFGFLQFANRKLAHGLAALVDIRPETAIGRVHVGLLLFSPA